MTQMKSNVSSRVDKKNLPAQPGDIWESNLKNRFGTGSKLMVTDETWDKHPGFFKCYYLIGCANIGPWTMLDSKSMKGFTLHTRKQINDSEKITN
jgi:hypothetical protein